MTALSTEALTDPDLDVLPPLRLVAVPLSAPPYDDEPGSAPVLRLVRPPRPAGRRSPRPDQPLVPDHPPITEPSATDGFNDEAWVAAERTPLAALPKSEAFARTLLLGVLEVMAGVRSVKQLRRDTTPEVYEALTEALQVAPRPSGPRPDARAVRSLHVQERPEGVVEVCATILRGPRVAALALRIEGLDGRWRCTDLVGV